MNTNYHAKYLAYDLTRTGGARMIVWAAHFFLWETGGAL